MRFEPQCNLALHQEGQAREPPALENFGDDRAGNVVRQVRYQQAAPRRVMPGKLERVLEDQTHVFQALKGRLEHAAQMFVLFDADDVRARLGERTGQNAQAGTDLVDVRFAHHTLEPDLNDVAQNVAVNQKILPEAFRGSQAMLCQQRPNHPRRVERFAREVFGELEFRIQSRTGPD